MNRQITEIIKAEIAHLREKIANLHNLQALCNTLPLPEFPQGGAQYDLYAGNLDVNNPTRDEFEQIRHAFPAGTKWERRLNCTGTALDYSTTYEGFVFRCWSTPPPASCKVEYEDVHVPAHIEKRAKIVCKEESEPGTAELSMSPEVPNV